MDIAQDHKKLVSYSLLAAMSDDGRSRRLDDLFIPFVKFGLVQLKNHGLPTKGSSIIEFRNELQKYCGLDFPIGYLSELLKHISLELRDKYGKTLQIFNDHSFYLDDSVESQLLGQKVKILNSLQPFEDALNLESQKIINISSVRLSKTQIHVTS